jgi:putative PIN family toxin of toxin-antitoxin system
MSKPRIVLDTNLVVSAALIEKSVARQAWDKVRQETDILVSAATMEELARVLRRRKFDKYVSLQAREEFLAQLTQESVVIVIQSKIAICRDPKDDKFLELAVDGKADCIVTGDDDLLVLHPFRDIPILTLQAFLSTEFSG